LTKYIKSVLWGVAVHLSYIQDAWCLKVKYLIVGYRPLVHIYKSGKTLTIRVRLCCTVCGHIQYSLGKLLPLLNIIIIIIGMLQHIC